MAFTDVVGRFWNGINGTIQNQEFNAEQAQLTRDFQKEMAQNQYQWAVSDIQAAGLNPAMMYQGGGSGGTAPSSANAAGTNTQSMNILGSVSSLMNSITNAVKAKEIDSKVADAMYMKAEAMVNNQRNSGHEHRLMRHNYNKDFLNSLWDPIE